MTDSDHVQVERWDGYWFVVHLTTFLWQVVSLECLAQDAAAEQFTPFRSQGEAWLAAGLIWMEL